MVLGCGKERGEAAWNSMGIQNREKGGTGRLWCVLYLELPSY
jgi:hypothetical protein